MYGIKPDRGGDDNIVASKPKFSRKMYTRSEAMQYPIFWVLSVATFFYECTWTGLMMHSVGIFQSSNSNWTAEDVSQIDLCISIASIFTCIILGFILMPKLSKKQKMFLLAFSLILASLASVLATNMNTGRKGILYGLIIGCAAGIFSIIFNSIFADIFGREHLGEIQSIGFSAMFFGTGLGPLFFGLANDNFSIVLIPASVMNLFCALWIVFVKIPPEREKEEGDEEVVVELTELGVFSIAFFVACFGLYCLFVLVPKRLSGDSHFEDDHHPTSTAAVGTVCTSNCQKIEVSFSSLDEADKTNAGGRHRRLSGESHFDELSYAERRVLANERMLKYYAENIHNTKDADHPRHAYTRQMFERGRGLSLNKAKGEHAGTAKPTDIESLKISLVSIQLCKTETQENCEILYQSKGKAGGFAINSISVEGVFQSQGVTGCKRQEMKTRTFNSNTGAWETTLTGSCKDHGTVIENWINDTSEWPEEDWIDLADENALSQFTINAKLSEGEYRSGIIVYRGVGKLKATISLDGAIHSKVYTKRSMIDLNQEQGVDYFPATIDANTDNLNGPMEEMLFPIKFTRFPFTLGHPVNVVAGKEYDLKLGFSLDRIISGYAGIQDSHFCEKIQIVEGFDNQLKCIAPGPTVFGLNNSSNVAFNVVVPAIIPLLFPKESKIYSQTYLVEIPETRSQRNQELGSVAPWYIRVELFFLLKNERESVQTSDPVYAAYFSALDYHGFYETVADFYNEAQISRVYDAPGFGDGQVYASPDGGFSLFGDDFKRLSNVGDKSKLTMTCANGFSCLSCKCDLENPLASFLFSNDQPSMRKKLLQSCELHPLSIATEKKEGEEGHGKIFELYKTLYGPRGTCSNGKEQPCHSDDNCDKGDTCILTSKADLNKAAEEALSLLPANEFTKADVMNENGFWKQKKLVSVLDKRSCKYRVPIIYNNPKPGRYFDNFPLGDPNRPIGTGYGTDCCPLPAKRKCTHKYKAPWGKGENRATASEVAQCEAIDITQQAEKQNGADYCLDQSNRYRGKTTTECVDICKAGGENCQCDRKCQRIARNPKTANFDKYPWRSFNDNQCFQKNTSYFGGWTPDGCKHGLNWRCDIKNFHAGDSGDLFPTGCNYTSYFYGPEGGGKLSYELIHSGLFHKGSINATVHGGGCALPSATPHAASNGPCSNIQGTIIKHGETCEASCATNADAVAPGAVSATGEKLSLQCQNGVLTPPSFLCKKQCQSPSTKYACTEGTSIRFGLQNCTIPVGTNADLADTAQEIGSIADGMVAMRDKLACAKEKCSDPTQMTQAECTGTWEFPSVNINAVFNCSGDGALILSNLSCA
eukprot:g5115.t1